MVTGKVSEKYVPTAEDTCRLLTSINNIHGVYLDYDLLLEFMFYYRREGEVCQRKLAKYLNLRSIDDLRADHVKRIIQSKGYARYFPKTDSGDISLMAKLTLPVLDMDVIDGETKWVVKTWIDAQSNFSMVSQFSKCLEVGQLLNEESCLGHRMLRISPIWVVQNTSRFAMQVPAIHNFAGEVKDTFTVPKGYIMVGVDSGQIDPRLTFSFKMPDKQIQTLIELYDDAYFGILHYVLMPEADIRSGTLDFKKMEITADLEAKRKTLKTHINAVIYDSHDDSGDTIKAALIKRIGQHPMHVAWIDNVKSQMMSGNFVFTTAFGTKIDVREGTNESGKYKGATESALFNHRMRSAINAPIQGTAADLHRIAINDQKKFLNARASKSFIMLSIHDAIYTAVHEDCYDDEIEFLSHCPEYRIDGWVPITCKPEIGPHQENKVFVGKRY